MSESAPPKSVFFLYCTQAEFATSANLPSDGGAHITGLATEVVPEALPSPSTTAEQYMRHGLAAGTQAVRQTVALQGELAITNRPDIAKQATPNPSLLMRTRGPLSVSEVAFLSQEIGKPESGVPWYERPKEFPVVARRVLRNVVMSYQEGTLLSREKLTDLAIEAMRTRGLPEHYTLTTKHLKDIRSAVRRQEGVQPADNTHGVVYIVPDNLPKKERQAITRRLQQDLQILQANAKAIVNALVDQPRAVHNDAAILQLRGQVTPTLRLSPRNNSRYNSVVLSLVRADKRLYVYKDQETTEWRYGVRENAQSETVSYKGLPLHATEPYKGKDARRKSISKRTRHRKNQKDRE